MKAKTRIFGEIDIADDKVIQLERGMVGFPKLTHFALIYDEEKEQSQVSIKWFQSLDDGDIAFPVMDPAAVMEDYNPSVNDELLEPLGTLTDENTFVLVTVTVPKEVEKFTVNLKAPIVINMDNLKGAQLIVEDDYPIKYPAYAAIKARKEKAGE